MGCGASSVDTYGDFQASIKAGILPSEQALDVQNVFDRFVFERGDGGIRQSSSGEVAVFPTFHGAVCRDPISQDVEHFLMVSIHTSFDGRADFRAPLRAIFVLDISGSMGQYNDIRMSTKTNLDIAKETLLHICQRHLRPTDEVAILSCNEQVSVLQALQPWGGENNLEAVKKTLESVHASGGSNLKAGVTAAYMQTLDSEPAEGEPLHAMPHPRARLFVLTDFFANLGECDPVALAVPGTDRTRPSTRDTAGEPSQPSQASQAPRYGVLDAVASMAEIEHAPSHSAAGDGSREPRGHHKSPVYTSFLFVGLDLRRNNAARSIQRVSDIVGCNAISVTPSEDAREHFDRGFECMVMPVVRALHLELQGSPFEQDVKRCNHGQGSNGPKLLDGDGEFFHARSIFPSPSARLSGTCGGVLLFKLRPLNLRQGKALPGIKTTIAMRVENAMGEQHVAHYAIDIPCIHPEQGKERWQNFNEVFQTNSIRKAVALWYYIEFVKDLLTARRPSWRLQNEISKFKLYFEASAKLIGDPEMVKEVALWDQLVDIQQAELKKKKSCSCVVM